MNFRLHDTRGLEADQGIDSHEISYMVDGHLPDRHQVLFTYLTMKTKNEAFKVKKSYSKIESCISTKEYNYYSLHILKCKVNT